MSFYICTRCRDTSDLRRYPSPFLPYTFIHTGVLEVQGHSRKSVKRYILMIIIIILIVHTSTIYVNGACYKFYSIL